MLQLKKSNSFKMHCSLLCDKPKELLVFSLSYQLHAFNALANYCLLNQTTCQGKLGRVPCDSCHTVSKT